MNKKKMILASVALLVLISGCIQEPTPDGAICPDGTRVTSIDQCPSQEASADEIPLPEIPQEDSEPPSIPI